VEDLDLVERGVEDFAGVLLPLEASEKEEGDDENPEDTEGAVSA
jgi:hypothetical protein